MEDIPEIIHHQDFVILHRKYSKAKFDVIQRDEAIEELRKQNTELREEISHLRSKTESLEYVKELSVDLQSRLGFASGQVDELRTEEERKTLLLAQKTRAYDKLHEVSTEQAQRIEELEDKLQETTHNLVQTRKVLGATEATAEKEQNRNRQVQSALDIQQSLVEQISGDRVQLQNKCRELHDRLESSQVTVSAARSNLEDSQREINTLREVSRQVDNLKIELQTLRTDNNRLVRLLCSTKEYQEFQQFWEDNDGVSFIPDRTYSTSPYKVTLNGDPTFLEGTNGLSSSAVQNAPGWGNMEMWKSQYNEDSMPLNGSVETSYWIPKDAMKVGNKLAIDLQHYKGNATKEMIDGVLSELNRIWCRRENRRVHRLRAVYNEKIEEMKRKVHMSQQYESVVGARKIERLESQILDLKRKLTRRKKKGYNDPTASSIMLAENTLRQKTRCCSYPCSCCPRIRDQSLPKKKGKKTSNIFKDQLLENSLSAVQDLEEKLESAMAEGKAAIIKGAVWFGKNASIFFEDLVNDVADQKDLSVSEFQKTAAISPHINVLGELHSRSMASMVEAVRNTKQQVTQMIQDLDYAGKLRDMRRFEKVREHMPLQNVDDSFGEEFH